MFVCSTLCKQIQTNRIIDTIKKSWECVVDGLTHYIVALIQIKKLNLFVCKGYNEYSTCLSAN